MSKREKSRLAAIVELFCDVVLLLCFITQAFLLGCLLFYGHLPLPTKWLSHTINGRLPEGLTVSAESYSLQKDGRIRIHDLRLKLDGIRQDVFNAGNAHVEFGMTGNMHAPFYFKECVFSEGRLSLPAVYSPSGKQSKILEQIALRLVSVDKGFEVDSFAARYEDIRLRGSIDWMAKPGSIEPFDARASADLFFKQVGNILKQKSRFDGLTRPTILFHISSAGDQSLTISSRLSSRAYDHGNLQAKNLTLDATLSLKDQTLVTQSSILLEADSLELPSLKARASYISAKVERDEWEALLKGEWPDMEVAAETLEIEGIQLESPRINLSPQAFPELAFNGFTSGLQGAVRFSGSFNTATRAANLHAAGSIDLLSIAPQEIAARLPAIKVKQAPYYILNLDFDEGLSLNNADLLARVDGLEIGGLNFDHIRFRSDYNGEEYSLDQLYLRRGWQWLNLGFSLDSSTHDYALTLVGFAKPDDYNALLPRWWETIFRGFDFESVESGLGDFVIYGNTEQKAADFFYGHARARNVAYKGVNVDQGELLVRGRGPYAEIHELNAQSGAGFVRGDIRFASRLDEVRGPMSVRLNLDTKLPLADTKKFFGENISTILSDFNTSALPRTTLKGAIFNQAYPEFDGRSYIHVTADCPSPIRYKGFPFDYLRFDLLGRKEITSLRNIRLGFADGEAEAAADILTSSVKPASTRFKLSLRNAKHPKAIDLLRQFKDDTKELEPDQASGEDGRLNLNLHIKGPANNFQQMTGVGSFQIEDDNLYAVQIFGPLSRLLQNTRLGFTSFALSEMEARFKLDKGTVHFQQLEINGPRTRIEAPGIMELGDFSLAMRVSVYLFGNAGNPDSKIRKIGDFITRPIPNLLEFELTGTPEEQVWRSLYDPRKFIPLL